MSTKALRELISKAIVQAPPRQPFLLASGRTSSYYVDMRQVVLTDGAAMDVAADALHAKLPNEVEAIGGIPTAGLLLVGPLLMRCRQLDARSRVPRHGFYTRPAPKGHGLGTQVEGHAKGIACLIEDTVTTGGSIVQHAAIARQAGLDVRYAIALLDREQGATEELRRHGITLLACVRVGEVL
jgi:orotate phosphoribosyltransferase